MRQPVWLMSSGGKDSMATLLNLQQSRHWQPVGLITTYNERNRRVALHGTPLDLLQAQAEQLHLPLHSIGLPPDCDNENYEARVARALQPLRSDACSTIAFGDLFLEDIRGYRERQFESIGWRPIFPLWQQETLSFSLNTIRSGVRAMICCVDLEVLDESFLGREWNEEWLSQLPDGVDPAGENGEFHTFVFDAPGMQRPIPIKAGSTREISHGRFCMLDLQADSA